MISLSGTTLACSLSYRGRNPKTPPRLLSDGDAGDYSDSPAWMALVMMVREP